tara:strand:+ start:1521 stop:1778 length:258 start_codon:yes stop_codon:yes gene_type:complete
VSNDLSTWLAKLENLKEIHGVWAEMAQMLEDEYVAYDGESPSEVFQIKGKDISQQAIKQVISELRGRLDDAEAQITKIENKKVEE